MKILIVTPFRYPGEGGLESHISNLYSGLKLKGHQVQILSASFLPNLIQRAILTTPYYILNILIKGMGVVWYYKIISIYFYFLVRSLHKKKKYDLINVQNVSVLKSVRKAVTGNKIPIVLTVHGDCTNEALSENSIKPNSYAERFLIELEKSAYTNADRIITVDSRLKSHVLGFIKSEFKINVIRNFADTDIFAPEVKIHKQNIYNKYGLPHGKNILLCPRRLVKKNGVVGAVIALSYLVNQLNRKNIILVYVGKGGQKNEIIRIAREEKVMEYIFFLGSIKHSKMNSLYSIADVVLIPSTYSQGVVEATSISAIEAMACELPIIATNIGGLKELIINEENGILVADKDYKGLACAIVRILDNSNLKDKISSRARKTAVENYSHLHGAEQFLEIYRKAMKDFHGS